CGTSLDPYWPGNKMNVGELTVTLPGGCITDVSLYGTWLAYVTADDLNYNWSEPLGPFAFVRAPP
ncbi:MAG: hypothetical protein JO176_01935, partial [Acidimicrobiia bacterium]|nr:hypothetical protein [Acidimicrobiia bacterium]